MTDGDVKVLADKSGCQQEGKRKRNDVHKLLLPCSKLSITRSMVTKALDLPLTESQTVSTQHANVQDFMLRDTSTNGTIVERNGRRTLVKRGEMRLQDGDQLCVPCKNEEGWCKLMSIVDDMNGEPHESDESDEECIADGCHEQRHGRYSQTCGRGGCQNPLIADGSGESDDESESGKEVEASTKASTTKALTSTTKASTSTTKALPVCPKKKRRVTFAKFVALF